VVCQHMQKRITAKNHKSNFLLSHQKNDLMITRELEFIQLSCLHGLNKYSVNINKRKHRWGTPEIRLSSQHAIIITLQHLQIKLKIFDNKQKFWTHARQLKT